jgi:hypothetical protein
MEKPGAGSDWERRRQELLPCRRQSSTATSTSSLRACSPCRRPRPRTNERGRSSASTLALRRSAAAPAFFFNTKHGHDYVRRSCHCFISDASNVKIASMLMDVSAVRRPRPSASTTSCVLARSTARLRHRVVPSQSACSRPPPSSPTSPTSFPVSRCSSQKNPVFISLSGVLPVLTAVCHP